MPVVQPVLVEPVVNIPVVAVAVTDPVLPPAVCKAKVNDPGLVNVCVNELALLTANTPAILNPVAVAFTVVPLTYDTVAVIPVSIEQLSGFREQRSSSIEVPELVELYPVNNSSFIVFTNTSLQTSFPTESRTIKAILCGGLLVSSKENCPLFTGVVHKFCSAFPDMSVKLKFTL